MTMPARRGRPSKASIAEMELIAREGEIKRALIEIAPDLKRLRYLAGYDRIGVDASNHVAATLLRLLKQGQHA